MPIEPAIGFKKLWHLDPRNLAKLPCTDFIHVIVYFHYLSIQRDCLVPLTLMNLRFLRKLSNKTVSIGDLMIYEKLKLIECYGREEEYPNCCHRTRLVDTVSVDTDDCTNYYGFVDLKVLIEITLV